MNKDELPELPHRATCATCATKLGSMYLCNCGQPLRQALREIEQLRAQLSERAATVPTQSEASEGRDAKVQEYYEAQPDGSILPVDPDDIGVPELLPCPFCGSSDLGDPNFECDYGIQCNDCGAMHGHEDRDEAIRLWNTRSALQSTKGESDV